MSEDSEVYIYLEFNEKPTTQLFKNTVFLRVANLHKPNPLVQVNDLIFKGTYDECVGTNLFFEEIEDPPVKTNIYEKETPIKLKFFNKQTKIIKLKQMKLPRKILSNKTDQPSINLNLNQNIETVLEKLEQGILNIDDLGQGEYENNNEEFVDEATFDVTKESSKEPKGEVESQLHLLKSKTDSSLLEEKYEKLKRLARRPVKRAKSPECPSGSEPKYKDNYEYNNLECAVLKNNDAFRSNFTPILRSNLIGGVDIDRCILQGVIGPSNEIDRVLTEDEIDQILTFNNMENLSLSARYLLLKGSLKSMKELIANTPQDQLDEKDETGRNVNDICNIFTKLITALESKMAQNCVSCDGKTNVIRKTDEDYIKLKQEDVEDLVETSTEIYNELDWTDVENEEKPNQNQAVSENVFRENWENSESDDDSN